MAHPFTAVELNSLDVTMRHEDAAVLFDELYRFGASDLACCCALALRASELSGGEPCRVEIPVDPSTQDDGEAVPVRSPGPSGSLEARLTVGPPGGDTDRFSSDRLELLITCAGVVLERHRLARQARQARLAADRARATLQHALRGHLHSALLRADNLLLGLETGKAERADVGRSLEELKATVGEMVAEIEQLVEMEGATEVGSAEAAADGHEPVPIAGLLREAGETAGARTERPRVEIADGTPPVRVDPDRLRPALGELFVLAGRSRDEPVLAVRPDGVSSVRVTLSMGPSTSPTSEAASPGGSGRDEAGRPRPSLPERVVEAGGRLWIETSGEARVELVVLLPTGEDANGGGRSGGA